MNRLIWAFVLFFPITVFSQKKVDLLPGEFWWAGHVADAADMPFDEEYEADLSISKGSQIQPLLLSNKGRYIWNEQPFSIRMVGRTIILEDAMGFVIGQSGNSLAEAQQYAAEHFMVFAGQTPDQEQFNDPVYNVALNQEMQVGQSEILAKAKAILDDGLPPGTIKIGSGWQEDHGDWRFDSELYPNPKEMIDELHKDGFKVMVWVSPFVSPDSKIFRKLLKNDDAFLKDAFDPEACKIVAWDKGYSALLDLTKPSVKIWFQNQLKSLQKLTGVDGFQFGGSDPSLYEDTVAEGESSPQEQAMAISEVGIKFAINEYDATWKMGGYPLKQSSNTTYGWRNLQSMINRVTLQGIMGYPYSSWNVNVDKSSSIETLNDSTYQELVVRSVQAQAFLPVMNISYETIKTLDKRHKEACIAAIQLHQENKKYFMSLTGEAAEAGTPIVQSMEFAYPEQGYQFTNTQFALGSEMIVAPVLEFGQTRKEVILPEGIWLAQNGRGYKGPQKIHITVELNTIPHFKKAQIPK